MALILKRDCECWEHTVSLNLVGRYFPIEAVRHIYCPRCSTGIRKNEYCMVEERGWLIEYDPTLLRTQSRNIRIIPVHNKKDYLMITTDRKAAAKLTA